MLAAHASAASAPWPAGGTLTAALAAVRLCAYTAGTYRGGVNDPAEGPRGLAWFEPTDLGPDPVAAFLELAGSGETDLVDHAWLAPRPLTRSPPSRPSSRPLPRATSSTSTSWSTRHSCARGSATTLRWTRCCSAPPPATPATTSSHPTPRDPPADAAALAEMVDAGHHRRRPRPRAGLGGGDRHRPDTAPELSPLLLGSLQDELAPEDLVLAVALVTAARFADTSFDPADPVSPVGPIHACTGANAIRRCLERARSDELRFELALCAPESPTARGLAAIGELSVPPFDDGAVEDLRDALADGDPDAAAEAASAVPPEDADVSAGAWAAVAAAAATDQWMVTHAVKHVVAMHEDFHHSAHPARAWFLAAAARSAAHANVGRPTRRTACHRAVGLTERASPAQLTCASPHPDRGHRCPATLSSPTPPSAAPRPPNAPARPTSGATPRRRAPPPLRARICVRHNRRAVDPHRTTGRAMTIGGVASATLVMFAFLLVGAWYGWTLVTETPVLNPLPGEATATATIDSPLIVFGAMIGAFILAMVSVFKPKLARFTGIAYALLEGVFLGAISHLYNAQFDGIVAQAILATFGVFLAMLVLYGLRILRATPRFVKGVIGATFGIMFLYLGSLIFSLFTGTPRRS